MLVLWLLALLPKSDEVIRGGLERRIGDNIPQQHLNSFHEGKSEGEEGEENAKWLVGDTGNIGDTEPAPEINPDKPFSICPEDPFLLLDK